MRNFQRVFAALVLASAMTPSLFAGGGGQKDPHGGMPQIGHGRAGPWDYDIWGFDPANPKYGEGNCHNAANMLLCAAGKNKAGILVCGGVPENSPAHHTANWIILGKKTCIVSWGKQNCWKATASPPDIDSEPGKAYAKAACGKQYGSGTRVLPEGKFVERPGPYICSLLAAGGHSNQPIDQLDFNPNLKPSCLTCCDQRADMWQPDASDDKKRFEGQRKDFLGRCQDFCEKKFRPG